MLDLRASRAFESFARLFKGGLRAGAEPLPALRRARNALFAHKDQEGGLRGKPYQGVSPFFLYACTCAPLRWAVVDGLPCLSTPFLWCLPKETVSSRQRKALFYPGGSTIRVSATGRWTGRSSPDFGEEAWWLTGRSSQLDAVGCDVGASSPWERWAGPNSCRGGTLKRVSLGLHPVSLRKSKEMGWNGQGQCGLLPNKTAHT